jgi:radical SAM protein with 4Fe4S-binding SPASM domain
MIFFTNLCQTNCRYCYAERKPIPKAEWLTLDEWRRILAEAHSLDIKQISLSGGDTFARQDGIDFVELLIQNDMLFLLSTKCLITYEYAERLVRAGFLKQVHGVQREFQISFDSVDPHISSLLSGRNDYVKRATTSILNLLSVGICPRIKTVVTPHNKTNLEVFVEKLIALGVNDFNFTLYEESFYWHSDDLSLTYAQKSQVAEILELLPEKYPGVNFDGNAMSIPQRQEGITEKQAIWKVRGGCSGGRSQLGIASDGKVIICEQTPQSEPFIFGNIRNSTILDIWNSKELLDFIFPSKENFKGTYCYTCHEFDYCQYALGNCFRDAYFATGSPFDAPASCPYREKVPRIGTWKRNLKQMFKAGT